MKNTFKIPGLVKNDWREYVYIVVKEDEKLFSGQNKNQTCVIENIIHAVEPLIPKSGGVNDENFVIVTPDNRRFYGTSYSKDIDGWRKQIELGSMKLNIVIAKITEDKMLITSDSKSYKLNECEFEHYGFYDENSKVVKANTNIEKSRIESLE